MSSSRKRALPKYLLLGTCNILCDTKRLRPRNYFTRAIIHNDKNTFFIIKKEVHVVHKQNTFPETKTLLFMTQNRNATRSQTKIFVLQNRNIEIQFVHKQNHMKQQIENQCLREQKNKFRFWIRDLMLCVGRTTASTCSGISKQVNKNKFVPWQNPK